jgi:hypothetical protein
MTGMTSLCQGRRQAGGSTASSCGKRLANGSVILKLLNRNLNVNVAVAVVDLPHQIHRQLRKLQTPR